MNTARKFFYLLPILVVLCFSNSIAGNHTVYATVEITATAINRYLNTQYNSAGFPRSVNVTYNGTNYTIVLTLPVVILTPGNAAIRMIFDVNTGTTNVYHFEVNPSINIPSGQITAVKVQAFLTDLPAKLTSVLPVLPQWLIDSITQNYNSLGFDVWPSKLIDQVNTSWFAQRSIYVVNPYFSLGWQVSQDILSLIVSTYLKSEIPYFSLAVTGASNGDGLIYIYSNVESTVKEVIIVTLDGYTKYYDYPNVVCLKREIINYNLGKVNLAPLEDLVVKVVYTINNTWYGREYNIKAGYSDDGINLTMFGPTKVEN